MNIHVKFVLLLALSSSAAHCSKSPANVGVRDAWMRPMLENGAAFMMINNTGGRSDTLVGASCTCATSVSLHETIMEGSVMRMVPIEKLEIGGYSEVRLHTSGPHLMLEGIDRSIGDKTMVPIVLRFQTAGDVEVPTEVRKL